MEVENARSMEGSREDADRPHISVRDLVVKYGDTVAVDGVSFDVQEGEHLTLLGPSGCGKTTTLRAIAGLEKPASGEILIGGEPVFSSRRRLNVPAERRDLSMVFQSYAIWPHMSVFKNVVYGLKVRKADKEEVEQKGNWALDLVRMREYSSRSAAKLSGGQQQRVALARSVAFSPRVLLFDEPLSNLDANLRGQMRQEIQDLQRKVGITSLYVTHDQEEALAISDRVLVMDRGRIVQLGTPGEIYDAPRTAFIADFIGSANLLRGQVRPDPDSPEGIRLAAENGMEVLGVDPQRGAREGDGTLALRTVYAQLDRERPASRVNVWPVTVRRALFSGDFIDYVVDWAGIDIHVRRPPIERFSEGEELFLSASRQRCVLLHG